jgi:tRNA-specific 2-thiouridylase
MGRFGAAAHIWRARLFSIIIGKVQLNMSKILVALSGGVDSSVCVHLLQEAGHTVAGVVLKMSDAHDATVSDAQASAEQLGIPLFVRDMRTLFEEQVISEFISEYQAGRTPNPCVICNPRVKFRALLDTADAQGYELVATGHYAGLRRENGITYLCRGESSARDQSYMLYRLTQRELSRLLFPLAVLGKDQVRKIAMERGLSCAAKPDSQEICFIPDNDYAAYIEQHSGICPPGDFIAPDGRICGQHRGVIHYTVGQRKRLGIALGRPVFIRSIDPASNRIYLADDCDTHQPEIWVSNLSETFPGSIRDGMQALVKIRSRAALVPCTVSRLSDRLHIIFDEPQWSPAPGQSAVLYEDEVVLGGGFIEMTAQSL